MTDKTALMIAYNLLLEELDHVEKNSLFDPEDLYYIEIKTAAEKIQKMIDASNQMHLTFSPAQICNKIVTNKVLTSLLFYVILLVKSEGHTTNQKGN